MTSETEEAIKTIKAIIGTMGLSLEIAPTPTELMQALVLPAVVEQVLSAVEAAAKKPTGIGHSVTAKEAQCLMAVLDTYSNAIYERALDGKYRE